MNCDGKIHFEKFELKINCDGKIYFENFLHFSLLVYFCSTWAKNINIHSKILTLLQNKLNAAGITK